MKDLTNSSRQPEGLFNDKNLLLEPGAELLATTSDFSVVYKINSTGQRDKEYPLEKPEDILRGIVLGDSFTFGEGISYGQRFTDIIEDHYRDFELLNFGIPGLGLDRMLVRYLVEAQQYSPDYVILVLSSSVAERRQTHLTPGQPLWMVDREDGKRWEHHFIENVHQNRAEGRTLHLNRENVDALQQRNWLFRHSHLASYLDYQYSIKRLRGQMMTQDAEIWPIQGENLDDFIINFPKPQNTKSAWSTYTLAVLDRFVELAKRNEIAFIVVNIDAHWDTSFVRKYEKDLLLIDLGPKLKNRSLKHKLRFKYDGHYNAATNRFIGEETIKVLSATFTELRNN